MKTLREYIAEAEEKKVAIGHFNICNIEGIWAVFNAARKLNVPVIIGASEGERDFVGVRQVAEVVKSIREEYDYPVFLNADHTYSFEKVQAVVDAGYDAVIYDGAKLSYEENVAMMKKCRDYVKAKNPNMLLEGELGYIGQSSKLLDKVPDGVNLTSVMTKPDDVRKFIEETGADLLAPAIGNFHGMLKSGDEPLHTEIVSEIRQAAGVPLVLHGGSGISKEDFQKAIHAGIAIVHINTELRVAFRKGLEASLVANPEEIAPYKYMTGAREAMEAAVLEKLKIFNNIE